MIGAWRHVVPAFERPLEGALLGKTEHERDVANAQTGVTQVVIGEFAPDAVNACLVVGLGMAELLLQR